ncbi:MAG: family 43 glycosylhydrolase [Prevotella sp.]|nr:family 43 glycosylhydrolase [Prevotella sp.]MBR1462382.1 family 43 glycosylhydrolase [Prevotella sp.]
MAAAWKSMLAVLLFGICPVNVHAQTFTNPILGGDYPDPTIMREGEDYYMTHSAFDYQPGLVVFHSKDLVHWEPISYALKTYLGSVWAPDICKYKDKYYIYFTVATQSRSNFVVWADSPYGPWSDPIDLHIGNIDPCHVVGDDGTRWLFMSGGRRAKLASDGLSVVPGTEETVYHGWIYPEEWETEGMCLEGPKLRKIGKYYYYLNAEGGTAGPPTSHMITQARSESINGPWVNAPNNPLVHTWSKDERWWSKGHGSLIDTPDGRWYVVYHSYEKDFTCLGRQTLLEPVYLGSDGWFHRYDYVDVAQPIALPFNKAFNADRHGNLSEFRLGLDWKFYKAFNPERVKTANGVLTLQAKGNDPGSSAPLMFISGAHRYEIEAEIELQGDVTAGLVMYYNSQFYQGTGFDKQNRYRYRKGGKSRAGTHGNGETTRLWLRLVNRDCIVTGWYSYDGINWNRETWGMDCSGYNHNTLYEFQSVLPGVFACGSGHAVFSNFRYRELE